jgi:pimeloyl-ACP methyl ester carboxylesterase
MRLTWLVLAFGLTCAHVAQAACADPARFIDAEGTCLIIDRIAEGAGDKRPLVVVVHGDGTGVGDRYLRSIRGMGERLAPVAPQAAIYYLQRPGYASSLGRSQGFNNPDGDEYTRGNVATMAAAVRALRARVDAGRVLWLGHSGGAAHGALILNRHHGLIDAAVLVGCPCGDVAQWRQHRNSQRGRYTASLWPNSLSPAREVANLPAGLPIRLLTGARDDNTLPQFAEAYVAAASARGADVTLTLLPGLGHAAVADAPEVVEAAAALLR